MRELIDLPSRTIIGKWKIGTILGRGGQGPVWEARPRSTSHSPPRALKACFADDPIGRQRFEREVALLQECESPHILKLVDADIAWQEHVPGKPPFAYHVTERCDGSLHDKRDELGDAGQRLNLFLEACRSVMFVHERNRPILHRDIKPHNFLLTREPVRLVLADFGIAKEMDAVLALTATHEVVGTPLFRAPEVVSGDPGSLRSDVYSLGRLLEWLLTDGLSKALAPRPIPRGSHLADDACEELDRIITKATQYDPADRFASVRELADGLPELWMAIKPKAKDASAAPSAATSPDRVIADAIERARAGDQLGWRQLEMQLRRDYPAQIGAWRVAQESRSTGEEPPSDRANSLLDSTLGRLVFALAGVFTNVPTFVDQRRVPAELLDLPNWKGSGLTALVEAPRSLIFFFHQFHGALCCELGRADLALRLAEVELPRGNREGTRPLWRQHDLSAWPKLLGGDCGIAWEYLRGLPQRVEVFRHFFPRPTDFEAALTSYSMLLSLLELARDASTLQGKPQEHFKQLMYDSAPMFLYMPEEMLASAAQRTFGNSDVISAVVAHSGTTHQQLRALWPGWKTGLHAFRSRIQDHRFLGDDLPIGELA